MPGLTPSELGGRPTRKGLRPARGCGGSTGDTCCLFRSCDDSQVTVVRPCPTNAAEGDIYKIDGICYFLSALGVPCVGGLKPTDKYVDCDECQNETAHELIPCTNRGCCFGVFYAPEAGLTDGEVGTVVKIGGECYIVGARSIVDPGSILPDDSFQEYPNCISCLPDQSDTVICGGNPPGSITIIFPGFVFDTACQCVATSGQTITCQLVTENACSLVYEKIDTSCNEPFIFDRGWVAGATITMSDSGDRIEAGVGNNIGLGTSLRWAQDFPGCTFKDQCGGAFQLPMFAEGAPGNWCGGVTGQPPATFIFG